MAERRRGSIRLWQTELFIIVIVVAILILSASLSAGLSSTLKRMTESTELRNASAFAQRLGPEFPLGADGTQRVRDVIAEYRDVYGGGIWVYDSDGDLLEASFDTAPLDAELESARLGALSQDESYVLSDLRTGGWIVAAKPLEARDGSAGGVVVTASSADEAATILRSVRDRLWVTFWTSLIVAGLIGFVFSELIARRIRAMSSAAEAVEAGDFEQRLPTTFVPDEIRVLADSYNSMAARLGEAFHALEESEEAQRRFVADASHEMRTPIAALKGMLELLSDGAIENPEVRDDFVQTMQLEVDRLGRLVADLLTLAQLEAGSLQLRTAPEYAADLVGDVASVMTTLADQSDVSLSVEVSDPDLRVRADRDRIVQVLLSFTDNALKHSPSGTTIHLRALSDGGLVRFEVADEGPGIAPEQISRVFERFYRADSARGGGSGTGLGLAIAKEIIEAHGADIIVRSASGTGTVFGFELPAE